MNNLIEALNIFKKYIGDKTYPTWCEHDVLGICCDIEDNISEEDIKRLDELGFFYSEEYDCYISYLYGSC